MSKASRKTGIIKYRNESALHADDSIAVEEPLEISISGTDETAARPVSVTMRTPGMDKELALGFLYSEGVVKSPSEIVSAESTGENRVVIKLGKDISVLLGKLQRHFYTASSCGVCGKSSLELLGASLPARPLFSKVKLSGKVILSLDKKLRDAQEVFDSTGGLHASALFNREGELLLSCEDVGRHNALDKLTGSYLLNRELPPPDSILLLSGRACYELIQKAAMAGIPFVLAIGAPSSLAVETARNFGITLIGFLREKGFNVYSGGERLDIASNA
jgi:FdhD protein